MRIFISITLLLSVVFTTDIHSEEIDPCIKFSKNQIKNISYAYINNNLKIENPVMVDMDEDGDFDILKFNDEGKVEYFKNIGSLTVPEFVIEDRNFDSYEMNTIFPVGIPFPIFMADRDGDSDKDIFAVVERENKNEIVYAENTMDLDHYTLITIILVLLIVVLVLAIV